MSSNNDDTAASGPNKRPRPDPEAAARDPIFDSSDGNSEDSVEYEYTNATAMLPIVKFSDQLNETEKKSLKALQGTKLDPIRALLAPQPEVFITTIIASSKAMLDLLQTTRQRESSHARFTERLVLRDDRGQPVLDTNQDEQQVNFIPRSIRSKNPVRSSDDVKEDSRIVVVMQQTEDRHKMYKAKQAKDIKALSGLEITIRYEGLAVMF